MVVSQEALQEEQLSNHIMLGAIQDLWRGKQYSSPSRQVPFAGGSAGR